MQVQKLGLQMVSEFQMLETTEEKLREIPFRSY